MNMFKGKSRKEIKYLFDFVEHQLFKFDFLFALKIELHGSVNFK